MKEVKIVNETVGNNNNKKTVNNKQTMLVLVILLVIILGVLGYRIFFDKDNKSNGNEETPVATATSGVHTLFVKDVITAPWIDIILDNSGNVYINIKDNDEVFVHDNTLRAIENSLTYSYNGKASKLIKIDVNNIATIKYLTIGNGGGGALLFLNNDNKLYFMIDYDIFTDGDLSVYTDDKLNNVTNIYNEGDEGGAIVIAEAIVNGKTEKINLYTIHQD